MTQQNPYNSVPAGYELKKKKPWYKRALIMIPLIILIIAIIAVAANGGGKTEDKADTSTSQGDGESNAVQPGTETPTNVMQYVLETDGAGVNATFAGKGANISQEQSVQSGWTKEVEFENKWDAIGANLSGQLDGSGTVTCKMLWNGTVVAENQSSGDYAMVTCSPDQSKM